VALAGAARCQPRGRPVSSAILYLAIVAIWAFMLVPRWLRRSHASPASHDLQSDDDFIVAPPEAELDDADQPVAEWEELDEPDTAEIPAVTVPAPPPPAPSEPAEAPSPRQPARPPLSRSKVLQARRRLLTSLILLTLAAVACTLLKLTSGWVCVPPIGMLGMYLLLLREAALADAEIARWRARQAHLARQRAQARARHAPQPTAEIIDISDRLGDQLYDQYADDTVRAVGD
jgi:hypothetical protein